MTKKVYIVHGWTDRDCRRDILCVYDNKRLAVNHIEECAREEVKKLDVPCTYDQRNGPYSRTVFDARRPDDVELAEFWFECWHIKSD